MNADKDIAFQAPVEMQIANEMALRYEGAMLLPNKRGKNHAQDFRIFRPLGVEVKCDYKAKESRNLFLRLTIPTETNQAGCLQQRRGVGRITFQVMPRSGFMTPRPCSTIANLRRGGLSQRSETTTVMAILDRF